MQLKGTRMPSRAPMPRIRLSTRITPDERGSVIGKKLLLTMKLTMMLMLVAILQTSANTSAQTVSYSGKPVSLQQMFTFIKEQTNYRVFCREQDLADAGIVDVKLNNTPLKEALALILADQPLEFDIQGRTIFVNKRIMRREDNAMPLPAGPVQGVVLDEARKPVPGVTVLSKKSRSVFITNDKGEFNFYNVPDGDTLVFTAINFETQAVPVKSGFMSISLKSRITALSSVTVYNTGFQVLSKERATGSFGKPDMKVFKERTGSMDVVGRLEGLVAGMNVNMNYNGGTANPTGNGFSTRKSVIRGQGTMYAGTDPLYVVNGVPTPDFSTVNPDDIEDITVLKDAAAAAIWGARAANGVVIVITNKGSKNQPVSVSYNGFVNFQGKPDFDYQQMMDSRQYINTMKEIFDPVAYPWTSVSSQILTPHERIMYNKVRGLATDAEVNRQLDSLAASDNRGQISDLLYRNGLTTNHTVSVSGGGNAYSFYASLGYTGVQSITPGERNNAYKVNVTQSFNAGKRLSLTLNTGLINTVSSRKNPVPVSGYTFVPYQLFQDAAGNATSIPYMIGYTDAQRADFQSRSRLNLDYFPLNEVDYADGKTSTISANITANLNIKLFKGLSFAGTYGYLRSPSTITSYSDNKLLSERKQQLALTVAPTVNSTPVYNYPLTGGVYSVTNAEQRNWTVRNQLVYETSLRKGQDRLSLQAGNDATESYVITSRSTLYGYDKKLGSSLILDFARLRSGISGTVTGYGSFSGSLNSASWFTNRSLSYFALGSYSINDKYYVDLSWRQDKTSNFGKDLSKQNKPVWSIGGRWNMLKEDFMKSASFLDNLSLRVTYGITGNSPYAGQGSVTTSSFDKLMVNPADAYMAIAGSSFSVNGYANKSLTWERTENTNIGVDYTVLKGRINGSLDIYQRVTTDMLGTLILNPFSGQTTTTGNLGKLVNKGIEARIQSQNVNIKDFSWTTTFVFAYNKNKMLKFTTLPYTVGNWISSSYVDGYPISPVFAYRYAGLDIMGDPQIYLGDKTVTKKPTGTVVNDLVYMGTALPVFNGGLSNTFRYKGLSLSLNMTYKLGHMLRREQPVPQSLFYGRFWNASSFSAGNLPQRFDERWKKPGDEAFTDVPSYVSTSTLNSRRNVDYYTRGDVNVASASYIKLRDISLSYEVPAQVLRLLQVQRLSLLAQATNFMVWKANDWDIDPEFSQGTAGFRPLPPVKHTYSLGLNLTF